MLNLTEFHPTAPQVLPLHMCHSQTLEDRFLLPLPISSLSYHQRHLQLFVVCGLLSSSALSLGSHSLDVLSRYEPLFWCSCPTLSVLCPMMHSQHNHHSAHTYQPQH